MLYINARFLTQPITGVQRYAVEISKILRIKYKDDELCFLTPQNIIHNDLSDFLKAKKIGKFSGHIWEQFELPFYIKKDDLLINMCNTAPILHKNKISTVFDLAFTYNTNWYNKKFKIFYNFLIPKVFETSRKIVTSSNTVKLEMENNVKYKTDEIVVIPCAVAESFTLKNLNNIDEITSYSEKYILNVGSLDPRKNIGTLLKAFVSLDRNDIKLKIIGGNAKSFAVNEHLKEYYNNPNIEFLGRVSDNDLISLYKNAEAFIFPSFYEGFGIPPLEALQYNCPILGSDLPVFHEIFEDTMMYFNPYEYKDIAKVIEEICGNEILKNKLLKNRERILSKYSFCKSADQWENLINKINSILV